MEKRITIGMDLGDQNHQVCILDAQGKVIGSEKVRSTRTAVRRFLAGYVGAVLAIETGTHSRWVAQEAEAAGLEVLVGNARKLRLIWKSRDKSDVRDAEMLARIGRFDPSLLSPIRHRGARAHQDLEQIKAREQLVEARSALINHVRSVVKGSGERLGRSSAGSFHRKARLPEELEGVLNPVMQVIEKLTEAIRLYDARVEQLAEKVYPETTRLRQVTGVGALSALAYVLTLEEAGRFKRSRQVGAFVGLSPRRDQSGAVDKQLRITKQGNSYLRRLLVNCAHYIMGPFGPPCDLRSHGEKLCRRGGRNARNRAVIAVARKLAVLLHALWRSGQVYEPERLLRAA